jgi:sugar lactone lactonase YvrE
MFKRIFAFLALACALCGTRCWAQTCGGVEQPPCPTGETVYVTNFSGHQIVKAVDDGTGTVTVINTGLGEYPEDIVVGPDGKIYVCDSDNSNIRRIDPSTGAAEVVYTKCDSAGPSGPEGPSFNTLGDLYFNTRGAPATHTGVWKITSAQLKGTLPVSPTQVLTATQTGSTFGEGTTFDGHDNLLVVDATGDRVLRASPPYTSATAIIISGLNAPIGVAVSSVGDIFVANDFGQNIVHYGPNGGSPIEVYASFTDPAFYLEFDASDRLFVVTSVDSDPGTGKLWRVDPPGGPANTHLVVDFFGKGLNNIHMIGLGLPATTFTTPQQPIAPGMTTTFKYGTIMDQADDFPFDAMMGGAVFMSVSFMQKDPKVYDSTEFPGTLQSPNWSGGRSPILAATITPIAGTGGKGIVAENLCYKADHSPIVPCKITAPTMRIKLTSHYKTQSPQPCPGFLAASDGQNNFADIIIGFDPSDPTILGGTRGVNSDEVIVNITSTPKPGEDDVEGDGDEQGDDGHKGHFRFCKQSGDMDFDEPDTGKGMRGHMDAVTISGNQAIITGPGTLRDGTPAQYTAVVLGNAPVIGANLFAISWITATGSTFHTSGALIDGCIVVHTQ